MSKQEFVELTVRVPKPVMAFFEAYWNFVGYEDSAVEFFAQRLSQYALEFVRSMVIDEITDREEAFIETYGLEAYREKMGFPKRKEAEKNE